MTLAFSIRCLFGWHEPRVRDDRGLRCPRCWRLSPLPTYHDPRPVAKNNHRRFKMPRADQQRARWAGLQALRGQRTSNSAAVVKGKLRSA